MNSPLKEDENYYRQVFFKEYRCIKKKVVRNIIDELESSSDDSDDSNDSDEEFRKNNFEGAILKMYFLRKQFWGYQGWPNWLWIKKLDAWAASQ